MRSGVGRHSMKGINGPEWACAAGLLLVGRGRAAVPKARLKDSGGLLSKLKSSLGRMFPPASGN